MSFLFHDIRFHNSRRDNYIASILEILQNSNLQIIDAMMIVIIKKNQMLPKVYQI